MANPISYYWEILKKSDATDVQKRCLVTYKNEQNIYELDFLNEKYNIHINDKKIISSADNSELKNFELILITLYYLINAKEVEISCEFVASLNLKGGDLFFTGSHELPTYKLIKTFKDKPELFLKSGIGLGGRQIQIGDIGFQVLPFPRIPMVYALWLGDDEIDANVSILFDKTIDTHFPLDIINGLTKIVTKKICGNISS